MTAKQTFLAGLTVNTGLNLTHFSNSHRSKSGWRACATFRSDLCRPSAFSHGGLP
jgi:hypothetical protein